MPLHKLTEEQRRFAEDNHNLVYAFLRQRGLDDDYYDVAVMGYLMAVQQYHEQEHLRKFAFSTIAYKAMKSSVYKCIRREPLPPVSLDMPIGDSGGLTLRDCVPAPDDAFEAIFAREEAKRALALCTERERRYFAWIYQGFTFKEIASLDGIPINTAGTRISRSRVKTRARAKEGIRV